MIVAVVVYCERKMAIDRSTVLYGHTVSKDFNTKRNKVFESVTVKRKGGKGGEKKRQFYLNSPVPAIKDIRLIRLYLTPVQISSQGPATCSEFTTIRRYMLRA